MRTVSFNSSLKYIRVDKCILPLLTIITTESADYNNGIMKCYRQFCQQGLLRLVEPAINHLLLTAGSRSVFMVTISAQYRKCVLPFLSLEHCRHLCTADTSPARPSPALDVCALLPRQ